MSDLTESDWVKADAAYKRAAEGYLEWCVEIARINADGDRQQVIADRYDISRAAIAQACSIGNSKLIVSNANNENLPADKTAIYDLVTAHDAHGEKVEAWLEAHPKAKRSEVKEMRESLAPTPAPKTVGWVKAIMDRIPPDVDGWKFNSLRGGGKKKRAQIAKTIDWDFPERLTPSEATILADKVEAYIVSTNPEYAQQVDALREEGEALMSKTAKEKYERTLHAAKRLLEASMLTEVRKGVEIELAEARAELEKERAIWAEKNAELNHQEKVLQERHLRLDSLMTEDEYKLIRSCLHPDRHPGEEEKYNRASIIWKRLLNSANWSLSLKELAERGWNKKSSLNPYAKRKRAAH